jgi:hypothetical protein
MNICCDGGWVIDRRPLPDDPHDHDGELVPIRGCTNLRCGFCKQIVRSAPELTLANPSPNVDARALFETQDLASSPLTKPSKTSRLYTCACLTHAESTQHPLVDEDLTIQSASQWSCAGHPIVALPHTFDGWEVTADNLSSLVERALGGELPAGAAAVDRPRAFWLARLCVRLAGTPHADTLARAVASHLVADVVAVRVRALQFFQHVPSRRGDMPLLALLTDHAPAFVGVANPTAEVKGDSTLEHALWRLAGRQMTTEPALRDLARTIAGDPARSSRAVLFALAEADPAWLAQTAVTLARAQPERLTDLIDACKRLPDSATILAALRALR